MKPEGKSVFPRPLSSREREITRWLISNGDASKDDKDEYLNQLERATVVGECACGCASIDFAIDGLTAEAPSTFLIGDFVTPGDQHGVFVYAKKRLLAGVEVFEMASNRPCAELPDPAGLSPVIWTERGLVRGHKNV